MATGTAQDVASLNDELNRAIFEGKALEAFEKLYDEKVVMQENTDEPFVGKALNRKREIEFLGSIQEFHGGSLIGTAVNGDRSYAEVEFDVTFKNGTRVKMTQVASRQWKNGKILHERFYYKAH